MPNNPLPPPPALVIARSKIVNPDGTASWDFLKILQSWATQINNSLNAIGQFIGTINSGAVISGRTEGIGTTVGKINSAGVITPPGLIPATDAEQGAVILPAGAAGNTLGSAALSDASDFDAAGSAATAQANAEAFASDAANAAQTNAEAFASNASNLSSGTVQTARLPGISGTVTLAKLTTGGANGSLTFVNGVVTAVANPS